MNAPVLRERLERFGLLLSEVKRRQERQSQSERMWQDDDGNWHGGLLAFVRYFWEILEPKTPLVEGWALVAICLHLEAVSYGEITRILITVPPGFMKSLLTDVFFPAWEWSARGLPHYRYISFSYSVGLTERDNGKFRDLLLSRKFQDLWGGKFLLRKIGEIKVTNDKTGSKLATSLGGIGTGERGDRAICDDLHNVKDSESEAIRGETVRWFKEGLSNRLNDMEASAIIVINQRVHESDVSGTIITNEMGYVHLCIPMEFDSLRKCETIIGWEDPREVDGELAWPERFPEHVVEDLKRDLGPYAYSAQYQQSPSPRGGGIIKTEWWKLWDQPKYPPCYFILASLDTAYTQKQENDLSALTVWGVFKPKIPVVVNIPGVATNVLPMIDREESPKIILLYAWQGREELHGLVETVATICSPDSKSDKFPHFPVDKLIIESKASGISVGQELKRLYGNSGDFGVELIDPSRWGDKVSRLYAVQHMFADEMVYAPDRKFADMVIEQVSSFPKAPHDDLVDSCSLALRYLRLTGILQRRDEYERDLHEEMTFKSKEKPLYG